ncbi:hypothetical protein J6590_002351 [Homalodisca vitripennis]|nr:hypothetical protein J6590_002351 [Homalodisca vitripennis]
MVTGLRSHECEDCGRRYTWPSSLRHHKLRECGKAPPHVCQLCPYRTYRINDLKRHKAARHGLLPDSTPDTADNL